MVRTRNPRTNISKVSTPSDNEGHAIDSTFMHIPPNVILTSNSIFRAEKRSRVGKEDTKALTRTHTWRPFVERYYSIPDAPIGHRKIYTIRVDEQVQEITDSELADGSAWTKFTNVSNVHGRSNRDLLANIITSLAVDECKPTRGYAKVGWNKDTSNRFVYILEDGRDLYGSQHYVVSTKKDMTDKGHQRMPNLPLSDIELSQADDLIDWLEAVSSKGHQLMCVSAIFRSYLNDIVPAYTSLMIYGASRIGKTTMALAACNLSFPTYYKDKPHASFQDTPASVETKIARQKSANCLIDDLMLPPTATEKDIRDKAAILEMIVRTTANGSEARSRMRRDLTLADANMFEMLPIITGEVIPPVLTSLERRMISIPIFTGDVELELYKYDMYPQNKPVSSAWDTGVAYGLLRLGHMSLRNLQKALNDDYTSVRYSIEQYEKDIEETLRTALYTKIDRSLSQLCEDIPQTYAKLHSGLYALGRYAFNEDVGKAWSNKLLPYSLHFMEQQINKMENYGQECSIDKLTEMYREYVSGNIRLVGEYHQFAQKRRTVRPEEPDVPNSYGLDKEFWGLYDNPENRVVAAYTHIVDDTLVYYPQDIYYRALLDIARKTPGYERFKTKQDIIDAYVKAGWVYRSKLDGKHTEVLVHLPGKSKSRCLELKLTHYIDISVDTVVTVVTTPSKDALQARSDDFESVTTMYPPNASGGYTSEIDEDALQARLDDFVTTVTTVTTNKDNYRELSDDVFNDEDALQARLDDFKLDTQVKQREQHIIPICPTCRTNRQVHSTNEPNRYGCMKCTHTFYVSEGEV